MIQAVRLLAQYQLQVLIGIGLLALLYLVALMRARERLGRTPFGLEREVAQKRQNAALAALTLCVILAVGVYLVNQVDLPGLTKATPTATTQPEPTVTPSPVAASQDIVVDSSGCANPHATLTAPKSGTRIVGSFEVHGTANIPDFAFYKFEISGAGTNGQWLSLGVGTSPIVDGVLGSFDASAREPGNYAFRLVVLDSTGSFPPPCVVMITIAAASSN
jgi:hypothetical protein